MCECFFPTAVERTRQPASLNIKAYSRWLNMMNRCYNPQNKDYKNYGGRGIKVCLSWAMSFERYLKDVGDMPEGKSLDRCENDGPYCPHNTAWKTKSEQNANRRSPKKKSFLPKGIAFIRSNESYMAQIRIDGTLYYIGNSKHLDVAVEMFRAFYFEWFGKNP